MQMPHRIFRTKNGMDVLLLKRPEKYTVGFSIFVNAGSMYEDEKVSGISHFFEHLFFTGTKTYPTEGRLRKRHQEIGLNIGAATQHGHIEVYGSCPKEDTKNALFTIKEMIFESLLHKSMIEKERTVILNEERQRQDNNYVKLWNDAYSTRFKKGNALQLPIEGKVETISEITKRQLLKFYKIHCIPTNVKLVLGSCLKLDYLEKLIRNIFEKLPKGAKIKKPFFTNKSMTSFSISAAQKKTQQAYFLLSFPAYSGDDLYKAWQYGFVMDILYEELNNWLRIKNGLVYELGAGLTTLTKNTGFAYIQSSCSVADLQKVLEVIFQKISSLKKGKINMKVFERLRNIGNKTLPMGFDTLSGAIDWCKISFYEKRKIYSPEYILKVRNKVTQKDLHNVSKILFDYKKLNLVSLGPISKKDLEKIVSPMKKSLF